MNAQSQNAFLFASSIFAIAFISTLAIAVHYLCLNSLEIQKLDVSLQNRNSEILSQLITVEALETERKCFSATNDKRLICFDNSSFRAAILGQAEYSFEYLSELGMLDFQTFDSYSHTCLIPASFSKGYSYRALKTCHKLPKDLPSRASISGNVALQKSIKFYPSGTDNSLRTYFVRGYFDSRDTFWGLDSDLLLLALGDIRIALKNTLNQPIKVTLVSLTGKIEVAKCGGSIFLSSLARAEIYRDSSCQQTVALSLPTIPKRVLGLRYPQRHSLEGLQKGPDLE